MVVMERLNGQSLSEEDILTEDGFERMKQAVDSYTQMVLCMEIFECLMQLPYLIPLPANKYGWRVSIHLGIGESVAIIHY